MLFKNPVKKTEDEGEDVDDNYDPEAQVVEWSGNKKLILPENPQKTGEEEEETIHQFRTKLYRWAKTEWKERGTGDLKFLKSKKDQKVRILMRQDKTHKIVANFLIAGKGLCQLSKMKTNEKTWVFDCYDYSDEEGPKLDKLAAKLTNKEECEKFQKQFELAYKSNQEILAKSDGEKKEEKKSEEAPKTTTTEEQAADKKSEEASTDDKKEAKPVESSSDNKAAEQEKPAEGKKEAAE